MRRNGLLRSEPSHFRAVVRTHPVTGEKALFVNPQFYHWEDGQRRHVARLTPRAEPPYETLFEE
ncbi:hypothetical protein N7539_009198 [Penicillium diatomitis]|uniref:TauD/TfdA-like domain-containing protein n=1 Tax=Penicillium diatomitis TaxID=2819901 RepID=A0A9X0BJH4_9EURO|nr:uncharacterized protein N7539_009198 [Penicillium diatomitis]KAJ5469580.1 hypothetical protein N7539_009198 [Penicillium diatomitis]